MYTFFILGIIPGTNLQITFTAWCLMTICLLIIWFYYRKNPNFRSVVNLYINKLYSSITPLKDRLISNVAGNKGFAVQFEILEQNLFPRVHGFTRQLIDRLKIKS